MGKQDPNAGRNWYVVHTYAGYEDAVRQSILQRVDSFGMRDYVFDVRVPKEKQLSFKKGEPVEKAIRRLKKKLDREQTLQLFRQHRRFEKPSAEKRRKQKAARFAAMLKARYAED
jgi:ribosomal protein S21